jgi:hypothetical protein
MRIAPGVADGIDRRAVEWSQIDEDAVGLRAVHTKEVNGNPRGRVLKRVARGDASHSNSRTYA